MNIFWNTLTQYNAATWPFQIAIIIIGCIITSLLYFRPNRNTDIVVKIYMIVICLWTAFIYLYMFCKPREYNNVMVLFWSIIAVAWLWDLFTGFSRFNVRNNHSKFALILMLMIFVYPLISIARGKSFPAISSPLMPSAVATYMVGMIILTTNYRRNIFIFLLICHWSLIGLTKTYYYDIPEDLILGIAMVPSVYYIFHDYYLVNVTNKTRKPDEKVMGKILLAICAALIIIQASALIMTLS